MSIGGSPVAIVVISEDGMINLIPDLRPQINHSIIIEAIEDLRNVLNSSSLNKKSFNVGMSFFKRINFYLTEEECKIINSLRYEIEEKFSRELAMMRIIYEDLKPHAEMNSSYYIDE